MLILGSRLVNTAVMSLQTGARLAQTSRTIIDPGKLMIYAYEVEGPLLTERPSFLRVADIREMGSLGMIIDSTDEFVGLDDIIKLKQLYELGFPLVGMKVVDEKHRRLGKVSDYTVDTDSFVIQQLHIRRGAFQAIADTGLLIHRSQIVEINDEHIIVKDNARREPHPAHAPRDYVNPFRTPAPAPDQRDSSSSA